VIGRNIGGLFDEESMGARADVVPEVKKLKAIKSLGISIDKMNLIDKIFDNHFNFSPEINTNSFDGPSFRSNNSWDRSNNYRGEYGEGQLDTYSPSNDGWAA
jgi:hypothetical protein